ncbi:MAG: ATP-binding cassette domain-containing protein [Solirubrobacteraceae bacterium]
MTAVLPHADAKAPPLLLEASGLSVSFGSVRALADIDLTVRPGELVAVAGEPGAGKTTLVRCIAGDVTPGSGDVLIAGEKVPDDPAAAGRRGIAVVWQDLALCDNLDVAGNVLLGLETRRLMLSRSRFHAAAASLLSDLQIPIRDTTQLVGSLSGGQRQLVAMAKALNRDPRLLVLDEPTASLGSAETAHVEALIARALAHGTSVLLASRDIEQVFRIADRIVVLRHGRVVAELDPRDTHPDDLTALLSGQQVDSSARRQLTRLHGLADRLESADPSSSLSLILSALGAALGSEKVCIHVVKDGSLVCDAALGFGAFDRAAWSRLPIGSGGGPAGQAAAAQERVVDADVRSSGAWSRFGEVPMDGIASAWSIPVAGPSGVSAVITVFTSDSGAPQRDELDLLTLYAGYAASAVERDRLLDQATSRNRVLETIREMLQTLAGPVTVAAGLETALDALRGGLQAEEVGLLTGHGRQETRWRAYSGVRGTDPAAMSELLVTASLRALADERRDGSVRRYDSDGRRALAVPFMAPIGPGALVATWTGPRMTGEETALIEDAAHSLRLALEREEAALANQEAAALRRSRELQRGFLSRLSHELRTPLTAIRGYASSLMQPDVTWDGDSEQRFLDRIAAESARLGRLVDDLLDFSAIESGVMRLQRDWCDIRLVAEAAVSCLPGEQPALVSIDCDPSLPPVWADHDRLEQVFVNLLTNALRHNPPGTRVSVTAHEAVWNPPGSLSEGPMTPAMPAEVEILVADDGLGFPAELSHAPFDTARRQRSPSSGAGLGLSITRGIIDVHGGQIMLDGGPAGTTFRIRLPVEANAGPGAASDDQDASPDYERVTPPRGAPLPSLTTSGDG